MLEMIRLRKTLDLTDRPIEGIDRDSLASPALWSVHQA